MKTWVLAILLIGTVVPSVTNAGDGYVSVEGDRFTGQTKVHYRASGDKEDRLYLLAVGLREDETKSARLGFISGRESWKYLKCHDLHWLIDDERLDLPASRHAGDVRANGVVETVVQKFTVEQLERVGAAGKVEYRICNDTGFLSPDEIKAVSDVAAALKG